MISYKPIRGPYNFRKPIPEKWRELSTDLIEILSSTSAFQRLKRISFLGAIDYALIRTPDYKRGNTRHTRYHHSRGVARLAIEYAIQSELPEHEATTLAIAALLHDIGHSPLSHSIEPVFEEIFGFGHHEASVALITGETHLGKELHGILKDQFIDIERVLALISGQDKSFDAFFSGPINFDTIEGVFRSYSYIARSTQIPNPHVIVEAATNRASEKDKEIVDLFWEYKDRVYRSVINSRAGILADFVCQTVLTSKIKTLAIEDYFSTDEGLFKRVPELKALLLSPSFDRAALNLPEEIVYSKSRRFFVDSQHDFFERDDKGRYKQIKRAPSSSEVNVGSYIEDIERTLLNDELSRQPRLFE